MRRSTLLIVASLLLVALAGWAQPAIRIATFDVDATPSLGSAMAYDPVKRLDELTLRCRGIVLLGAGQPVVLCAVDWIGIANEGHDAFRAALAEAVGTCQGAWRSTRCTSTMRPAAISLLRGSSKSLVSAVIRVSMGPSIAR